MYEIVDLDNDHIKNIKCNGATKHISIKLKNKINCLAPLDKSWVPKPVVMPYIYQNYIDPIKNFHVRADDIWVITFPKCGTTWTQEMVWLINNELDFEKARDKEIFYRFPFLEISGLAEDITLDVIKMLNETESPRFIKSHLPVTLLPHQLWTVKPKIIYVYRNPKDTAISYYHHFKNLIGYRGTIDAFLEAFLADMMQSCPMIQHILEFWQMKDEKNLLILTYEEMKRDLKAVIQKVMMFYGKSFTDDQINKLMDHLSFDSMQKNSACNYAALNRMAMDRRGRSGEHFDFIRKGKVGSYKDEMPEELIHKFDEWIERSLAGTDFKFSI